MAFTEIYVDPSLNSDSGDGTSDATAYGDLEWALEQQDMPAGPTRVNIKAGTAELPAVEISTAMADTAAAGKTSAWVPAIASPLVFQGYTATAGDGGVAEIDCGGNKSFYSNFTLDYVHFKGLEIHNSGSNKLIVCDNHCSVINCNLHDCGNTAAVDADDQFVAIGNYFTEFGTNAIACGSYGYLSHNYALSGALQPGSVALSVGQGSVVFHNIVNVRAACWGIYAANFGVVMHNSVYSAGGTGKGINGLGASVFSIFNNLVEGFSGSGGVGIDVDGATNHGRIYGGNSVYDCATAFTGQDTYTIHDMGGNETLTASPFTDASSADFSPVDTGAVKEGSLPADFADGLI